MTLSSQRGAATLAVTLMLLAAMLVTLLAANRNLLIELRQSSNQADAALAFETAEAGLDWALARLNDDARTGGDCQAAATAARSFREQLLDTGIATFTPRGLAPACVHGASGWACGCGPMGPVGPAANGPGFTVSVQPGPQDGRLLLVASACAHTAGVCGDEGALARHQAVIALQAALPMPPAAALTVRPAATPVGPFFAGLFGQSKASWTQQQAVRRIDCHGDCGAAVTLAVEQGATLLALPGDVLLRGPLALGTPERPVLIVAAGTLQLQGAVQLHGVAYAASLGWTAPAATVRGALISEGGAAGDASLDLQLDAAVLDALRTRQGGFVRVAGGWRDF
ncbi:PilX N-terminal domain-containing pilus assembly protein [Piscinibacter sp.]|uniref:pilus assembly PilX family protein n=1 Tax=Piscinibacter sp. TaxID=1903157 RepID=UPI0039E2F541